MHARDSNLEVTMDWLGLLHSYYSLCTGYFVWDANITTSSKSVWSKLL